MSNIIFTLGTTTFTWSVNRVYPVDDPAQVNVPVDYSEGGQLYAYDKGIEEKYWNLTFEAASTADNESFESFLLDTAVGPKNAFTMTDESGGTHTVRLLDTKNPLKKNQNGKYEGTIHLREEI